MKIKKFNENFEELVESEKILNFKNKLQEIYDDAVESVSYDEEDGYNSMSFDAYWDMYRDIIIKKFDVKEEEENVKGGDIRTILPQMVQKSNNSKITRLTAQRIVDTFSPAELNDFRRWLQLIK